MRGGSTRGTGGRLAAVMSTCACGAASDPLRDPARIVGSRVVTMCRACAGLAPRTPVARPEAAPLDELVGESGVIELRKRGVSRPLVTLAALVACGAAAFWARERGAGTQVQASLLPTQGGL